MTVLADTAIRAKDLDEASAKKAKEDAERALANRTDAGRWPKPRSSSPRPSPSCGRWSACAARSSTEFVTAYRDENAAPRGVAVPHRPPLPRRRRPPGG